MLPFISTEEVDEHWEFMFSGREKFSHGKTATPQVADVINKPTVQMVRSSGLRQSSFAYFTHTVIVLVLFVFGLTFQTRFCSALT